uniref:ShKT domain-containing protein n=1 Tax=Loa loa TaxID=7209 RepID=A0A1I7VRY1_LOALO
MQSRIQNFAGVAFARLFSAERIPRRLHDHLQKTNKARKGTYNAIRRPYTINCDMEVDDKGDLCQEWAKANLCDTNRATMFLFCRRTCLCVGPPTNIPP